MRKNQPNQHQKGGAGGQQKMNPQYPHQPRGVRPGGPGSGVPNNNSNNKMMNSGGAQPPRRQGIPTQQQQNVAPVMMNPGFQTMAEMVGAHAGEGMVPYSYVCSVGARTPNNPAGGAQVHGNPSGASQGQPSQGNDGSGVQVVVSANGSNAGQGPTGPQGQQVTSASPPLMQQGSVGGGQVPSAPQQQQAQPPPQPQVQNAQQQQQGPPQGQHAQQIAQQIMMGHPPPFFMQLPPQQLNQHPGTLMQHTPMAITSHVPGLHPQQPQPPSNSSGSSSGQNTNNSVVGGSGGVGQRAGSAGVSNAGGHQPYSTYLMHAPDRVVVQQGGQHVQPKVPGAPYMSPFPGNLAGMQGAGGTGSNVPNSVVGLNTYPFNLSHPSPIVVGNQQPPQGLHHHQLHATGAAPTGPMIMTQMQEMRPMVNMMPPTHQPPIYMQQVQPVQQAAPKPRERKALVIKHPTTGEDVVANMLQEQEKSANSNLANSSQSSSGGDNTKRAPAVSSAVRITSAPSVAAAVKGTTGKVESAPANVTPTVSANLDQPDEFLPHLQKTKEPTAQTSGNATTTTTKSTPAASETETVTPSVNNKTAEKVVETNKPESVAEATQKQPRGEEQQPSSDKKVHVQADVVVKSSPEAETTSTTAVPVSEHSAAPEQPKVKNSPAATAAPAPEEKSVNEDKKRSKAEAPVEDKAGSVAKISSSSRSSSGNNSVGSNANNKCGNGAGNEAKATCVSIKKNDPSAAAQGSADQVSSSAAVAVDEIDRAAAPVQRITKGQYFETSSDDMVVATDEVVSSIPKEEKEMINYKKEKEATAAEDQEAAKPIKGAAVEKSSDIEGSGTKTVAGDGVAESENVKEVGTEKPSGVKLVLQYDEGQWSPLNVTGRKAYSMDQMRLLQTQPISQKQPEKVIDDPLIRANPDSKKNQSNVGSSGGAGGGVVGGTNLLFPHFYADQFAGMQRPNNYNSKRNHSQTGSNVGEGKKPIVISLSLSNDVKLNQAENAWRPSVGSKKTKDAKEDNRTEEEKETEQVYKSFRIILNKLTPENFAKLTEEVKELAINTAERVNGCMEMVFEKAVIEPNYTLTYAMLCKAVAQMGPNTSDFKAIMLTHCQKHFESLSDLENTKKKRQERLAKLKSGKTGDAAKDAEQMAELKAIVEEEERKERHRSVGIVRFIGELFKQSWISHPIISNCVEVLLRSGDEEYLECLCKLLTTVGPKVEEMPSFKSSWKQLEDIVEDKERLSSRVRFMILDLLDLRNNKWVPRRAENKPKAISQIHKEEERAFQNNQEEQRMAQMAAGRGSMSKNQSGGGGGGMVSLSGPRTSSQGGDNDQRAYNKGSQRGNRRNDGRDNRPYNDRNQGSASNSAADAANQGSNSNNDDGEWIKAPTKRTPIDPAKFKPKTQVIDDSTKLGSAMSYRNWTQTKNSYATLQEMDSKDSAPPKGDSLYTRNSMERDRYEGRGSSTKSSRENSSSRMGGGFDSRDRGRDSMNYGRNDRGSGGGGGRNQRGQFMGGSSSTSSYSSSQRYDEDDRSGSGKGGRVGSRGGSSQNRSQGGGGGKGSLHGSKSIGESTGRPIKMEIIDSGALEDTDPTDQSFLELDITPNILMDVLNKIIKDAHKPEDYTTELSKLAQKSLMARDGASAVQVVKKQVYDAIGVLMERKEKCRQLGAQLLAYCINNKFVSRSVVVSSLGQFFISVEDIIIDVPKVWTYVAEFLGPAMLQCPLNLTDIAHALELVKSSDSPDNGVNNLIVELGTYFAKIQKPEILYNMWHSDKLSWSKFVRGFDNEDELVKKFLVPKNLYYISNESALKDLRSSWGLGALDSSPNSQDSLANELDKLLEGDFDETAVKNWIKSRFESIDESFIKLLSMAIIRSSVEESGKLNAKSTAFEKKLNLLRTYLGDRKMEMEVAALHGIQYVDLKMEHPKELLKTVFGKLFDDEIVSRDAFYEWKHSKLQPEGKGVALKMLANFFANINDIGTDEEDSPAD